MVVPLILLLIAATPTAQDRQEPAPPATRPAVEAGPPASEVPS